MGLSIGIVGLPNVGKSTLFNALTNNAIPAENYPFCTIDPNVGIVPVADIRLNKLKDIVGTKEVVPTVIEYNDIAGLVRGAHKGEGLGNEFLGHIRAVDAIVHVLRDFTNDDITHVENRIDPLSDKEIIETELILKDMESVEKQLQKLEKESKRDKSKVPVFEYCKQIKRVIDEGNLVNTLEQPSERDLYEYRKSLFLLTDKPILYVINTDLEDVNNEIVEETREKLNFSNNDALLLINIKQEYDLSQLEDAELVEFKETLGISYSGLEELTRVCYNTLDLISFFTAGEKEVRAWTVTKGSTAPQAAGVIHTDFEEKFITAEVVAYDDFVNNKGWLGSKEAGKFRLEGKGYVVKDGDVMNFRHGA